jgi:hypothetical protein
MAFGDLNYAALAASTASELHIVADGSAAGAPRSNGGGPLDISGEDGAPARADPPRPSLICAPFPLDDKCLRAGEKRSDPGWKRRSVPAELTGGLAETSRAASGRKGSFTPPFE